MRVKNSGKTITEECLAVSSIAIIGSLLQNERKSSCSKNTSRALGSGGLVVLHSEDINKPFFPKAQDLWQEGDGGCALWGGKDVGFFNILGGIGGQERDQVFQVPIGGSCWCAVPRKRGWGDRGDSWGPSGISIRGFGLSSSLSLPLLGYSHEDTNMLWYFSPWNSNLP